MLDQCGSSECAFAHIRDIDPAFQVKFGPPEHRVSRANDGGEKIVEVMRHLASVVVARCLGGGRRPHDRRRPLIRQT
jgi:hypothetical protein